MTTRRPALAVVLAVVVTAGPLVGCSDPSLGPAALRRKADAVCLRFQDEAGALGTPTSLADLTELAPKLARVYRSAARDLAALDAGDDDAATMRRLVARLRDAVRHLGTAGDAGRDDDQVAASEALGKSAAAIDRFAAVATKADFDVCGLGGPTGDPITDVDLGATLQPIEGGTYEAVPQAEHDAFLDALRSSPDASALVKAIGMTLVNAGDSQALLIFLGLAHELDAAEAKELVDGVTGGGEAVTEGQLAGATGWAYVDSEGRQGFVTVRSSTVIIGLSSSTEHLAGVVAGLFAANPDL